MGPALGAAPASSDATTALDTSPDLPMVVEVIGLPSLTSGTWPGGTLR